MCVSKGERKVEEVEEDESNLISVSGTHLPCLSLPVCLHLNSSYYCNFDCY